MNDRPIGMLDSGVGGLSILREIRRQLTAEDVLFFADQAHLPYGPRPLAQVRAYSQEITRFLLALGVKLVVVACNTASAAALHYLRKEFPETPFVGMEPAVKPAAEMSHTRVVGVLATPATFQGELFASVVERFAGDVRVLQQTLPGLVERVEAGDLDGPRTRQILVSAVGPLLEQGVDTIVLACTHYPFVIPHLAEIVGPNVQVIDPSPAIARQTQRVLADHALAAPRGHQGKVTFLTSGDPFQLAAMAEKLIGQVGVTQKVVWQGANLVAV